MSSWRLTVTAWAVFMVELWRKIIVWRECDSYRIDPAGRNGVGYCGDDNSPSWMHYCRY